MHIALILTNGKGSNLMSSLCCVFSVKSYMSISSFHTSYSIHPLSPSFVVN